jgi:hypothetical protein
VAAVVVIVMVVEEVLGKHSPHHSLFLREHIL